MKRKQLFEYLEALNAVSTLKGVKFAYAILKNKKKIEEEVKVLEEIIKPQDEFVKYENERIQLCTYFSEKNEKNEPIIENNQFKILDKISFNEELDKIKTKYIDVLDDREKQINDYNAMVEEEIPVTFDKVSFNDLPQDISSEQLEKIDFMINLD
jgi:hypothetical protein